MKFPGAMLVLGLAALTACKAPPAPRVNVVGLWPQDPPLRYKPFHTWSGGNYYDWPRLRSSQPTLRWEVFPRPADLAADTDGQLNQFKSVTYDLRIWESQDQHPSKLVYSRDALPVAVHRVDRPLARAVWHFWSVRARFEFQGRTRVSEWSRLQSPEATRVVVQQGEANYPDSRYYQFYVR